MPMHSTERDAGAERLPTTPDVELAEALSRYYSTHGLPADGGASAKWFRVHLGRLVIPVPNPPARRRAVFYHDAHHVLAGYDTVFSKGEVAIAAFEVGAGCGRYAIAWIINLPMMLIGIILRPRAAFRAFVRGRHSGSIYHVRDPRSSVERMTVSHLRTRLLLDRPPAAASLGDVGAFVMWTAVALGGIAAAAAVAAIPVWWMTRMLLASTGADSIGTRLPVG